MKRVLRAVVAAAAVAIGLLGAPAPADAGVTWGTGCGGPFVGGQDECTFIAPLGALATVNGVAVAGSPGDNVLIDVSIYRTDGSLVFSCVGTGVGAWGCHGSGIVGLGLAEQVLICKVRAYEPAPGAAPATGGAYACQAV